MAIIYKIEADGGFVCGDTNTGLTAYAYPTSPHASNAAKSPAQAQKTADAMIKAESPIRRSPIQTITTSGIGGNCIRKSPNLIHPKMLADLLRAHHGAPHSWPIREQPKRKQDVT